MLLEVPCLLALAQHQVVATHRYHFQANVVERLEAERLFNHRRVFGYAVFRETLQENAVAHVLEIAIDENLAMMGVLQSRYVA